MPDERIADDAPRRGAAERTVVVVNPSAGGGRVAGVWERLRDHLELVSTEVVRASDRDAVRRELADRIAAGARRILVFGGDGSANLVANVVLELGRGHDTSIGLIPVGTGGDLARGLGVPRDPRVALEQVLRARVRSLDAIEVSTDDGRRRFVLNVASAGISGLVDAAVNAVPQRGAAAYLGASFGALRRYRNLAGRITIDGEPWYEGEMFLLAVANGTSFGRGMRIAPHARFDDGLLDVVLVGALPRWQVPFRFPQIYRGTHLRSHRYVRWGRCRQVRLEPLEAFPPFDLDGEVFDAAAARFTVLPGALRMLA